MTIHTCTICTDDFTLEEGATPKKIIELKDFDETTEIVSTTCNHLFHQACLAPWVKNQKKSSCPNCNQITLPKAPKVDLSNLTQEERISHIFRRVIRENPHLFRSDEEQQQQQQQQQPPNAPRLDAVSMEIPEEDNTQPSSTATHRPSTMRERLEELWRNRRMGQGFSLPKIGNLFHRDHYQGL